MPMHNKEAHREEGDLKQVVLGVGIVVGWHLVGVLGAKVEAHSLVTVEVGAVLLVVGVKEVPGEVLKEVSEVALKNFGLVMVEDCSLFCTFYSFFLHTECK